MKHHSTIGCCGIDCGLCPRFYTNGTSACPGCCGNDFQLKHPSCGFVTCCVVKRGLETCAHCTAFPCKRFENEKSGYDSFVSHRQIFPNLNFIQEKGLELFLNQQNIRIDILTYFLKNFDDGRSKNYFCLSCALLPINQLLELKEYTYTIDNQYDVKDKCKILRIRIQELAVASNTDIRLKNK